MSWDNDNYNFNRETKPKELPEDGFYDARLVWLLDLGTREKVWEGKPSDKRAFYIAWELIGTQMSDGRPFLVGNEYNVSNGQWGPWISLTSNLYKLIMKPWFKGEDEKNLKRMQFLAAACRDAKPCKLTISRETSQAGKEYISINGIKPHIDPTVVPMPQNASLVYDVASHEGIAFEALPEWVKKKVALSKEWTGAEFIKKAAPNETVDNNDPDLPF
jgi:hypothetical protein